jgi:ADP-ribose pyrophosphatase YjhB (NUDIX family)
MKAKHAHCSYCGCRYADGQPWPRRCAGCGETTFLNPAPVAVILLPVDDGILLIRRGIEPQRGKLALPGGYVDWGETWQEAGAREVREETGIIISPDELVQRAVYSAPPGLVLIFGEARPRRSDSLPPFDITDETTERLVTPSPIELAFPLHNDVMRDWFTSQRRS